MYRINPKSSPLEARLDPSALPVFMNTLNFPLRKLTMGPLRLPHGFRYLIICSLTAKILIGLTKLISLGQIQV